MPENQIKQNKPFRNVGIGNLYYAFAQQIENLLFENIINKAPVLKTMGTTEDSNFEQEYASNVVYDTDESVSGIQLSISAIAFSPAHKAKMKGHTVQGGFIKKNVNDVGAYFAIGVVYPKKSGHATYTWYPKCKLTEMSNDAQTRDSGGINSQDKSLTISVLPYTEDGDYSVEYDTELLEEGATVLTEDEFFSIVRTEFPS
ncbi:MAG: hypothetical protein IJ629_06045 [Clostridia bacterium]|nr:hypothetical protein [Clostridia bacterium]